MLQRPGSHLKTGDHIANEAVTTVAREKKSRTFQGTTEHVCKRRKSVPIFPRISKILAIAPGSGPAPATDPDATPSPDPALTHAPATVATSSPAPAPSSSLVVEDRASFYTDLHPGGQRCFCTKF